MASPMTTGLPCLFLLVTACCQTSQDSRFEPLIHYIIGSGLGEESFQPEMQRQKRNMLTFNLPPLEYTVDIEVSLMDSSFLQPIKDYFKNFSLPVSTNISNVEMTVSDVHVTTACLHSSANNSCCSCEDGHAWPSAVCGDLRTCPSVSLAPDLPCSYMKERPFHGPYCEPQTEDSCGMGELIVMNMSVRLNTDFRDDLHDSSSELYQKYKADLEKAFNASYRCLPGFVSATVTGFRPGSVFVNYDVKAGAVSFDQIAHFSKTAPQFLDASYGLDPSTFIAEITNRTNFSVNPVDIFEGDTVRLTCEINSTSQNVTWYHFNEIISSSSKHSIKTMFTKRTSKSILEILNVTVKDLGSYRCVFTKSNHLLTMIYNATKTIAVSPLHITPDFRSEITCNRPEGQVHVLSCCIDRQLPSLTGDWKVNGAINMTGVSSFTENCTEYKLNVDESLCSPEKSGTVTTYTCELETGHGARGSYDIRVTFLWAASVTISSSVDTSVSEGYPFSLRCGSDVGNYDSVTWKIQTGNHIKTVDCDACIKSSKFPARSLLTVKNATQDWSGIYTCTFSQKSLEGSASAMIEVIPMPRKQSILIDPIEASVLCRAQQTLQCCISRNIREDYTVKFVVGRNEVQVGKVAKGNMFCFMYNYTEAECGQKEYKAHCKFINRVGQEVNSEQIKLHLILDNKVSCADTLGIGIEGATLIKPCSNSNLPDGFTRGNITYKCSKKSWKAVRNDCLSEPINTLLTNAESLVNSPQAKADLPDYLAELKKITENQQSTISSSPANLDAVVTILDMVSAIPAVADNRVIENFLSTVDYLVANSTREAWQDLDEKETLTSSSLLNSVENFSLRLQPVNNTIPSVSTNSIQLQGTVVRETNNTGYSKSFNSTENVTVDVHIGEAEIQSLVQNSTIVSVMYSTFGRILPQNETERVNGLLITTTVSSNRSQKFDVNMTFSKINASLKKPQCVFWNFTLSKQGGGWDTQGCTTSEVGNHVVCSCNHLTSFSILMSPDKSSQLISEDYITYIGLAISILSLAACVIIESLVWKYVTNNTTSYMRHVCILNIATSLLIADVWFIVTASIKDQNQQMSRSICAVATFFIHLFYLCVFFWMLSLGLILFYRLVFILHNTSKTAQKAVVFSLGYGCPFIIAVVTIAITLPRNSYTRSDACWLNWQDSKALLAFVIPALAIVATNLFITAVVIIKILRPTIGDRSDRQERNALLQIGKSVAILTPLLGLTWGFGLATVIKNSHRAFHILFALLNGLQGLFILVFGTLWDKKIQEALLKRNSMSKWSSQQTKSSSLILVTPMLAMSYPFSRTFNNLCGKTGKYRVSSSEPSTSSSENTSKAYSLLN